MSFRETTIESEMIYEGKILNLRKDKVNITGGKTSYREIIEHKGAVALVPINDDGNIVLVRQFRKAAEKEVLEIPAGKMEEGEDPLMTAKRELEEETGYCADSIIHMTSMYPAIGYSSEIIHLYLAKDMKKGKTCFDEGEDIEIVEISLKTAVERVLSGEIEDAKTIAGILMVKDIV